MIQPPPMVEQAKPTRVDADLLRMLVESAMDEAYIKRLGLTITPIEELEELGRKPVKTATIPYFDLSGQPTGFKRYRYLVDTRSAWEKLTSAKPQRYFQPAGTGLHPYFAPLVNWKAIAEDPKIPLIITEGEKKAACATANGFPTIGLGGVDCFADKAMGSKRDGQPLLPELEVFKWEGRQVTILYDSDASTNPDVLRASIRLGRSLYTYKAVPKVVTLPMTKDGAKQGIDDFILECRRSCVSIQKAMTLLLDTAQAALFEREIALYDYNARFVYIRDMDKVICRDDGILLQPEAFVKRAYVSDVHMETTVKIIEKKKVAVPTYVPTAEAWMKWGHRTMAKTLDFSPTEGEFTTTGYNIWRGWPVEAKKGDATLWSGLLDRLFQNVPPEDRRYFEQWCAYPVQNPGAKLKTAALLWSHMEGNGKSTVLECLRAVYGGLFVPMNDSAVDLQWTDWLVNRLMVGVDDISAKTRDDHAAKWRNLISAMRITVQKRYTNPFEIDSHVNFIMTSNEPNALRLTTADRRYFIHEAAAWATKEKCAEYCEKVYDWLKKDGPGNLRYHLMNVDLTGFAPDAPALLTQAKLNMVESGKGPLEKWLEDLKDAPEVVLRLGATIMPGDLWTSDDLAFVYNNRADNKTTVSRVTMGMALAAAGFKQAAGGKAVRLSDGRQARLYPVRDHDAWFAATTIAARDHYEKTRGAM